jgi:hypothetical protein
MPGSDQDLDTNSVRLSGELAEVEQSWEGRKTDFEDPILQSFANAYVAASQAGRKDLIPVLVNNIKQGFIKVKSKEPEIVTFEQRNDPNFDLSVLKGKNKILDYRPNGDVHVYELTDERQLENIQVSGTSTGYGTGGALTKVAAARMATAGGVGVLLTSASNVDFLDSQDCRNTWFQVQKQRD